MGDDLAAAQVVYSEAQVAVTFVCLEECGIGELAKKGAAGCWINEVRPVTLTLQDGTDVLRSKDELREG